MADLDDFFAKKDRKKSKGKKFTTTEEIAKKLEETGKRAEKSKPKEKPTNPEGEENQQIEEEDEWKEFEEEKKDYSGLKIGNLQVTESTDVESEDGRGTGDNSSDGELGELGSKNGGPWKKTEVLTPVSTVKNEETTQQKDRYKAPRFRNQPLVSASSRQRLRNVAPDINSEEYFPTLSSKQQQNNNELSGPWSRRKKEDNTFEEVRNRGNSRGGGSGGSSSIGAQETSSQGSKLSLDNKYDALSQDQS